MAEAKSVQDRYRGPFLTRRQFLKWVGATAAGTILFGSAGAPGSRGTGCSFPIGSDQPGFPRHYNFLAHFAEAEVQTPDPAYVMAGELVPVAGEMRFCLFAQAPADVAFAKVPLYERGRLQFGIGIHQEAWEQDGDGVIFIVEVVDEAGQFHRLFERQLDPFHHPEDRAWFDETVDLAPFAGQHVQIVLRTEAGENNRYDWAAWSTPRLFSVEPSTLDEQGPLNVLFLTIDTLRADHLSSYGYPRQTSPTLDRLAEEGVRFAHAYCHSNYTNPSHLSMLTGAYPRSHGVANNHTAVSPEVVTIPERLQARGYHTVGAVSAYHLGPVLNLDQGFADFYSTAGTRHQGETTSDIALEWLIEQGREPFFMWVHYFDPHAPYLPRYPYNILYDTSPPYTPYRLPMTALHQPDDWPDRYGDWPPPAEDVAEVISQYDGAIAYTDAQVARLLAYLEEAGLADTTIVIVTADHGEGFGEHGVAFDHYGLHEEVVHVPLIVRAPGRLAPGQVLEELVGHVDLGPTLFELLGLPIPEEMPGKSLVPLMEGRRWRGPAGIVSQQHDDLSLAVRTTDWRLILQRQDHDVWPLYPLRAGQLELYDVGADPGEKQNLWPAASRRDRKAQEELAEQLLSWEGDTPLATWGETPPLDEETEEMLRRLGY